MSYTGLDNKYYVIFAPGEGVAVIPSGRSFNTQVGGVKMKVRSPMHSIDVRGKFGTSLVFAIWRGLNYIRGLTIPANPQTDRQMLVRGYMTTLSRAWAALVDGERQAWRDYALLHPVNNVFGQTFLPSGFNVYVGLNSLVLDQGLTAIDTPPIVAGPGGIAGLTASPEIPLSILLDFTAPGSGMAIEVQATGIIPPGRIVQENQYRHVAYTVGTVDNQSLQELAAGEKYGVRVRIVLPDGQAGPWSVATSLAGAAE